MNENEAEDLGYAGVDPGVALVLRFEEIEEDGLAKVGGKGLSLGFVARAGLPVPPGFCVTTEAYRRFVASVPGFEEGMAALEALAAEDTEAIREGAAAMRARVVETELPSALVDAVTDALHEVGGRPGAQSRAFAVRSSATLEDLPEASFAGQHDSHLEVRGAEDVLVRLRDCFASLFTDRAVAYRRRQGLHEADAAMAVVIQAMAASEVAGVLFTADPVGGSRDVCVVDASYGLGEAVVSGIVNPDGYRLNKSDGALLSHTVGDKALAIRPLADGGTETVEVPEAERARRALDDAQLSQLADLCRQLEALYGEPQDVEWGFEDGRVQLLQSRPITSLYPLPSSIPDDGILRVYVCMGHQQANPAVWSPMTTSLLGLVLSLGLTEPGQPTTIIAEAGHRAYVDLTAAMHTFPLSRAIPRTMMEISPAIGTRLRAIVDRPDFVRGRSTMRMSKLRILRVMAAPLGRLLWRAFIRAPERARHDWDRFIKQTRERLDAQLGAVEPGAPRLRIIAEEAWGAFKGMMLTLAVPVLLPGMISLKLLEGLVKGRVPDPTVMAMAAALEGNIVTEMDAALGELAEAARAVPAVAEAIASADVEQMRQAARRDPDGARFIERWDDFIDRYGHRGPGEIDVARPRWRDDPTGLLNTLAGILQDEPGAHHQRLVEAKRASAQAEVDILRAAGRGVFGLFRRWVARFLIRRVRGYVALREHHKYWLIMVWGRTRTVLLEAGALAVERGWLERASDVFMLHIGELRRGFEVDDDEPRGGETWRSLRARVESRAAGVLRYERVFPPAVMLSTGEVPAVPREGGPLPPGTFEGIPVSSGEVVGIARVLRDPSEAVLAPGEILVAPFTDAAWTTLFVHAGGVVLEAGGSMSHGSVIAREYGIPAVVGLAGATTHIASGQRIRVDGESGRVEILDEDDAEIGGEE